MRTGIMIVVLTWSFHVFGSDSASTAVKKKKVLKYLNSSEYWTQVTAMHDIKDLQLKDKVFELRLLDIAALGKYEPGARIKAAYTIGYMQTDNVQTHMRLGTISQYSELEGVREAALWSLGESRNVDWSTQLQITRSAIRDPHFYVRLQALQSLKKIKPTDSFIQAQVVKVAVFSKNTRLQKMALEVLEEVGKDTNSRIINLIRQIIFTEKNQKVKLKAEQVLLHILSTRKEKNCKSLFAFT